MSKSLTTGLYRILLREARKTKVINVANPSGALWIQRTIDPKEWGYARLFPSKRLMLSEKERDESAHGGTMMQQGKGFVRDSNELISLLKEYHFQYFQEKGDDSDSASQKEEYLESFFVSSDTMTKTIQQEFRLCRIKESNANGISEEAPIKQHHRYAIDSVRFISEQLSLNHTTSIYLHPQYNIRVIATSKCIGRIEPFEQAEGDANSYRFAYRIRIENLNDPKTAETAVQLLGRLWYIADGDNDEESTQVVNQPTGGAVGHLPVIQPGHVFEYCSGCDLKSATGEMEGQFYMAVVGKDSPSEMVHRPYAAPGRFFYDRDRQQGEKKEEAEAEEEKTLFNLPVSPFKLIATV